MTGISSYIITIESREERVSDARALASSLETSGVFDEVSLHPAIYWKNEASIVDFLTEFPQYTFTESWLEECLMGQLAVTLSHISVWRRLLTSDYKAAVVFEDDVYVTDIPRFAEIVAELEADPEIQWARLHLHKRYRDEVLASANGATLVDDIHPWGFAAYYVTRSGARKLLQNCHDLNAPIDALPPALAQWKRIRTRSVGEVIVDHPPFVGDAAELEERAEVEREAQTLQKTASAIYTSPRVADNAELRKFLSRLNHAARLRDDGVTVLRGVFDRETMDAARKQVLDHRHLFKNTRPTQSAGHLAGFHRFPGLESLHRLLTADPTINALIDLAVGGEEVCTIGLSDITINRSQPWHVDLLRGKYRKFLNPSLVWGVGGGGVYKALLYLNDSSSLQVAKGSHLKPISLESDLNAEPGPDDDVAPIAVRAGDVVIMDLRCRHRGADESAYSAGQWDDEPRMLVSTVFGAAERGLTKAMEIGNFMRLMEWWGRLPKVAPTAKQPQPEAPRARRARA